MILLIKLSTAAALAANRGGFIEQRGASPEFQKLILILIILAIILSGIFTLLDIKRENKRLN
jgi:hypothetical protein